MGTPLLHLIVGVEASVGQTVLHLSSSFRAVECKRRNQDSVRTLS
jgi:hypothetical protein